MEDGEPVVLVAILLEKIKAVDLPDGIFFAQTEMI
jgi:hypothetical protein